MSGLRHEIWVAAMVSRANTTIADARFKYAMDATERDQSFSGIFSTRDQSYGLAIASASACARILYIVSITFTGLMPMVVSSDVMVESARRYAVFATSVISARVGNSLFTIEPNIWVATITGLFILRHSRMIRREIAGTSAYGTSTARSPRAIIMPSAAAAISVMRSTAFGRSIFAIILIGCALRAVMKSRTSAISSGFCTNEIAT